MAKQPVYTVITLSPLKAVVMRDKPWKDTIVLAHVITFEGDLAPHMAHHWVSGQRELADRGNQAGMEWDPTSVPAKDLPGFALG